MTFDPTWSQHLVRSLTRLNGLKPLNAEEAYFTRQDSPKGMSPTSPFTGRGTIIFRDKGANYRGSGLVTYSSLNVATLFKNIPPVVWLYNPRTTHEIVIELARRYGLPLDPAWFVNEPFDHTNLPKSVELKVVRTDFTVEERLTVRVERADADLSEIFTKVDLEYPKISFLPLTNRTSAEFSYHQDFTPDNLSQYKDLVEYPTGPMDHKDKYLESKVQTLVSLIKERLELPVYYEVTEDLAADDVCFRNSVLVYNGPTRNYVHPDKKPSSPKADTWYDRVLVIRFDDALSGWQGLAYFHYNNIS